MSADAAEGNYWIYLRGLCDCSQRKTQSLAVLHYKGVNGFTPTSVPNTYDERPSDNRVGVLEEQRVIF